MRTAAGAGIVTSRTCTSTCGTISRRARKTASDMAQRKTLSNPAVAIPDAENQVRAFGHTLAMTEWLSPQELQASQTLLACKLLLHARRTTPFYKDRLDADLASPEAVRRFWSDIPILTRSEATKERFKLISRRPPREM